MTPMQEFAVQQVINEFLRASNIYPKFNSEHEGYAVILEEVEELWADIMNNKYTENHDRIMEAVQIGAMALRYVHDLAHAETMDILDRPTEKESEWR